MTSVISFGLPLLRNAPLALHLKLILGLNTLMHLGHGNYVDFYYKGQGIQWSSHHFFQYSGVVKHFTNYYKLCTLKLFYNFCCPASLLCALFCRMMPSEIYLVQRHSTCIVPKAFLPFWYSSFHRFFNCMLHPSIKSDVDVASDYLKYLEAKECSNCRTLIYEPKFKFLFDHSCRRDCHIFPCQEVLFWQSMTCLFLQFPNKVYFV